jgi:hypothetical protein
MDSLQIGSQAPAPVNRGGSASYTITVTKINSGSMDVYLSALDLPQGATASFSPSPIKFGSGTTVGRATMTISTTESIVPGPHLFGVLGRDGGSHNTITNAATLDVTLSSPGVVQMANGSWCFAFATEPGQSYKIQANTNFSSPSWTTLCTTNAGTNNLLVFIDRDAAKYPCRIYRSVAE